MKIILLIIIANFYALTDIYKLYASQQSGASLSNILNSENISSVNIKFNFTEINQDSWRSPEEIMQFELAKNTRRGMSGAFSVQSLFLTSIASDKFGNIYASVLSDSYLTIRRMSATDGSVSILAGPIDSRSAMILNGETKLDGLAIDASFGRIISGLSLDKHGNIYLSDTLNHTIRKIAPLDRYSSDFLGLTASHSHKQTYGLVTTIAGVSGKAGNSDGNGNSAQFRSPAALCIDSDGNIYVADRDNHTIRKITGNYVVSTFAGLSGVSGGKDGESHAATFNSPRGVALDQANNLYVADTGNHVIRKITPDGVVTLLAGTVGVPGLRDGQGRDAKFNAPEGLAVDGDSVYVADTGNNLVRKISAHGVVDTLIGTSGSYDFNRNLNSLGNPYPFASVNSIAVGGPNLIYVKSKAIVKGMPAGR
jgi:hypothetical protein